MVSVKADPRCSLPTLNWLQFASGLGGETTPLHPLLDILDAAAAAGFSEVGLDAYTVRSYVGAGGRVEELGDLLGARGLTCSDVSVLAIGAPDVRADAAELATIASATGAGVCIAAVARSMATADVTRELEESSEILAAAGVRLALEFVPFSLLRTMADAIPYCEAVGWERCGLLVDTWHFFRGGEPWELFRSLDATQIALVHADDAPPMESDDLPHETRDRRVPLGAGSFDLAGFAGVLEEIGYDGPVSLEVLSAALRLQPPVAAARTLIESAREHWPLPRVPATHTD